MSYMTEEQLAEQLKKDCEDLIHEWHKDSENRYDSISKTQKNDISISGILYIFGIISMITWVTIGLYCSDEYDKIGSGLFVFGGIIFGFYSIIMLFAFAKIVEACEKYLKSK